MSSYRVDWTEEAERGLAAVWTGAADQAAVTAAARRLDASLGRAPFAIGESRDDFDIRVVFDRPLALTYRVEVFARTVVVLSVGPAGRG